MYTIRPQSSLEIALRRAVFFCATVAMLGTAYVLASTVMYHVTVKVHNAINGHDH